MTQVVVDDEADTSAYEYEGTLDYGTNYFWRVMALEPAPSDWSATFVFQTARAPAFVSACQGFSYSALGLGAHGHR